MKEKITSENQNQVSLQSFFKCNVVAIVLNVIGHIAFIYPVLSAFIHT